MGLKLSRDGDDPKEATEGWNLSTAEETTGAALPDEVPSATMRVLGMAGGFLSSSASSDLLMAVLRAGGTFVGLGCLCESAALLVGAGFFLSSSSPFLLAGLRAVVMARSGFQRWKKVRQLFFFKCCEIVMYASHHVVSCLFLMGQSYEQTRLVYLLVKNTAAM
jgi:hypothetical protein